MLCIFLLSKHLYTGGLNFVHSDKRITGEYIRGWGLVFNPKFFLAMLSGYSLFLMKLSIYCKLKWLRILFTSSIFDLECIINSYNFSYNSYNLKLQATNKTFESHKDGGVSCENQVFLGMEGLPFNQWSHSSPGNWDSSALKWFLKCFSFRVLISRFDLNFSGDYDSWSHNIPGNQNFKVLIF